VKEVAEPGSELMENKRTGSPPADRRT